MSMQQLTGKIDFSFGKTNLDEVLNSKWPSLIPIYSANKKLGFGPPTSFVIAPPSSGEESEEELPYHPHPSSDAAKNPPG